MEYKDDDLDTSDANNVKAINRIESKVVSKSNRKIDLGAAANFGKDHGSIVSREIICCLFNPHIVNSNFLLPYADLLLIIRNHNNI